MPDTGHVPHEEMPEEFNKLMINFAQGLE